MNYSHFVGLDVGKNTFDASIMSFDEKEVAHDSFANTFDGIRELLLWLSSYGISFQKVLFCAENMGNYVTDICLYSIELCFPLSLVCPLAVKRSMGLQRGKSDRIDARRIANYAVLHHRKLKLYKLPDKDLIKLRSWMLIRDNLVKQKVSSIKLLETTSNNSKLADIDSTIVFLKDQLKELKEKIKRVELSMEEIIISSKTLLTNYKLLTSIKGIGMINAIVLLCATGNFERFTDARKFACYCGVAPFEHTSGVSIRGKTQTSKLANKEVKVYLTRAAITAMCWDPQMKAYYKRKTKEGKHKASVINAIRAKMIARCFAVVRRQTPYVTLVA